MLILSFEYHECDSMVNYKAESVKKDLYPSVDKCMVTVTEWFEKQNKSNIFTVNQNEED